METEGMRSLHSTLGFAILLGLALAACAPGAASAPSTPSLVPVNLAGPEMTIGATWLYADGSLLVAVPAGVFTMGGGKLDGPPHQVNLPDFWIYRTKVTNFQYAYCVAVGGCTPPSKTANPGFDDYLRANDPVVGVDYSQASAYCTFVHARPPTEAEWEKAARGPDAALYPWGATPPNCDLVNYGICKGTTTPVNSYPAGQSYYKAFDMEGNALEWVADWYQADYYLEAPADNPQGPDKGQARSVRSSAFNSGGDQIPAFTRSFSSPDTHRDNLGFRCVVEDPNYFSPFCQYPAIYGTDGVGGGSSGQEGMQVTCPELTIEQNLLCNGGSAVTIVSMAATRNGHSVQFGIYLLPPHCDKVTYTRFACSEPGQIRICAECRVQVTVPPQCPEDYTYDEATKACLGQGTPGACLPGSTPDPTGQCCTYEPGAPVPTGPAPSGVWWLLYGRPDAHCPPGTWQFPSAPPPGSNIPGPDQCLPVPVQSPFCRTEDLALKVCQAGGDGGGCNITESSCANTCNPLGYIYDAAACSCTCNAG